MNIKKERKQGGECGGENEREREQVRERDRERLGDWSALLSLWN